MAVGGRNFCRVDVPHGEPGDGRDRSPRRIDERDGEFPRSRLGQPSPQRRCSPAVRGGSPPRERHPPVPRGRQQRQRLQHGVEYRRVDSELPDAGAGWQARLREDLGTAPPDAGQPLEQGAVVEPGRRRVRVEGGQIDRNRPRRRPCGRRGLRQRWRHPGQHPAGASGPLRRVVRPRVHADLSPLILGRADDDLHLRRAPGRQHQRVLKHEFVHGGTADLGGCPQREVEESGRGKQDLVEEHVVGQPGVGRGGDFTGEQGVATRCLDLGGEERVAGLAQARGRQVTTPDERVRPVPVPLEGVGGQVHPARPGPGEDRGPVHVDSVHVQRRQRLKQRFRFRPVAVQRRKAHPTVTNALLGQHTEHGVRPEFEKGVHILFGEGTDPVGEAHGLADVAHPVGR